MMLSDMKKRVIYSVELPLVLPKNMPKFKHKRQLLFLFDKPLA